MTLFDLVFIVMLVTGLVTLAVAVAAALRGKRARALGILRGLAFGSLAYVGTVYLATAFSKQVVPQAGCARCVPGRRVVETVRSEAHRERGAVKHAAAAARIGYHEPTLEVPSSEDDLGLMVDCGSILPFCVIIGECGAFHKGVRVGLRKAPQ